MSLVQLFLKVSAAHRVGVRLHPGEPAFKLCGDDLARQSVGRHIRRHVERFDHQRAIMRGRPDRNRDKDGQRQKHERCSELER